MAFFSAFEQIKNTRTRHAPLQKDGVTISTETNTKKGGTQTFRLAISPSLAKQCKILHHDRVDVMFDPQARMGKLVRLAGDGKGWAILHSGQKDKMRGQYVVRITHREGITPFLSAVSPCTQVTVVDDGIVFDLPPLATFKPQPVSELVGIVQRGLDFKPEK